jgi:hypothetical protein
MGDLRVAVEDLAEQILPQVLAGNRVTRQFSEQFVVAFEEQGVAVVEHLFGFAQGDKDAAQVVEQGEVVVEVAGHGAVS